MELPKMDDPEVMGAFAFLTQMTHQLHLDFNEKTGQALLMLAIMTLMINHATDDQCRQCLERALEEANRDPKGREVATQMQDKHKELVENGTIPVRTINLDQTEKQVSTDGKVH